jgi:predicted MFS family arabinose efflux permease
MSIQSAAPPESLPPAFRHLERSYVAAQAAEQVSLAAVPIVAVTLLGAGPAEIGLLAALQSLPFLLLSIPFGLLADRLPRRRIMLWSEGTRALALVALLLAVLFERVSIPLLGALGFVGALGTVGFSVCTPALVPDLAERGSLARANGRLELARSLAFAAGPALAGALVSWSGASSAFTVAALLSVAALSALLQVSEPPRAPTPRRHPWVELSEGARLVWHHGLLRPVFLTAIIWNLSWFVLQAAYVPYAARSLGFDATTIGFTLTAYGLGMLGGALVAGRVIAALPFGRVIQVGPLVSVLAATAMLATLVFPSMVWAALSFFLFGAGPIIWTISTTTLRQAATPGEPLGRVSALFLTAQMGARPLGAALGGWVGSSWGEAACLVLAAVGFALQAGVVWWSKVSSLKRLPDAVAAL